MYDQADFFKGGAGLLLGVLLWGEGGAIRHTK
jgi:hypothetical protein